MRSSRAELSSGAARNQQDSLAAAREDIDNGLYNIQGNELEDETDAANKLGSTIEPNSHPQADDSRPYFGYHGQGHMDIAELNDGVMKTTVTAVRDVVFWEWHKGIDEISFRWQEKLQPYT